MIGEYEFLLSLYAVTLSLLAGLLLGYNGREGVVPASLGIL